MKSKTKMRNREFTVTAKSNASFEKMKGKAHLYGIPFYPKGKARKRLYFYCSEKVWSFFSRKIQKDCICNSSVDCPTWVNKRIVANLLETATTCLVPQRRNKAQAIFKNLGPNSMTFYKKALFEALIIAWTLTRVGHFVVTNSIAKLKALLTNTPKPKRKFTPMVDVRTDLQIATNFWCPVISATL